MIIAPFKLTLVAAAGLAAAALLCPLCDRAVPVASAQTAGGAAQATDTAIVRLHISGMTCGTCPATARLALRRLPGVHAAVVTLDDSLGVVWYDRRRVRPEQIVAHLTRLTGYGAVVLPDSTRSRQNR